MVSRRLLRDALVLAGAFFAAESLGGLIVLAEAGQEIDYGWTGRLGELWIAGRQAAPRALGAVLGAGLLWLALGSPAARRWAWWLAALIGVSGFFSREIVPIPDHLVNPVSQAIDTGGYVLLPALASLLTIWVLVRYLPAAREPHVEIEGAGAGSRARLAGWSVLMFLAGGMVGTWIAWSVDMRGMTASVVTGLDLLRRSEHVYAQYRDADYEAARAALEGYLDYLDAMQPSPGTSGPGDVTLGDEQSLTFDRMLTFGRLALRAERANRSEDAERYWVLAEEQARSLRWEAPTRDRVRETVERLDAGRGSSSPVLR